MLTEELQGRLIAAVAETGTYRGACRTIGLSIRAFEYWLARGRELRAEGRGGKYVRFVHAMEEARADAYDYVDTLNYRSITEGDSKKKRKLHRRTVREDGSVEEVWEETETVIDYAGRAKYLQTHIPERYPVSARLEHTGSIDMSALPPVIVQLKGVQEVDEDDSEGTDDAEG